MNNTISYFFIIIFMVIFSSIGIGNFKLNFEVDPLENISFNYGKKIKLSEDGRVALHELLKTDFFSTGRVGPGGHYSQGFDDLSILLNEKEKLDAFKYLLENSLTVEGKAYALLGLYFTNQEEFNKLSQKIKNSQMKIVNHLGCTGHEPEYIFELFNSRWERYNTRVKNRLDKRYQWLKNNGRLFKPLVN